MLSRSILVIFFVLTVFFLILFRAQFLPTPPHKVIMSVPDVTLAPTQTPEVPAPLTQIQLKRGPFPLHVFPALLTHAAQAKALILFESSAAGWSTWEDKVGRKLQADGYDVLGIDARIYAENDFDLVTLQGDYQSIAGYGLKLHGKNALPLILAGWSAGAEQVVAVAGGPKPPDDLAGLLLISPRSWGGYGHDAVHGDSPRPAKGSDFALKDFGRKLRNLHIAQWHADGDDTDSTAWLHSLKAPHREFDLEKVPHNFGGPSDDFLARLSASVQWILGHEMAQSSAAKK